LFEEYLTDLDEEESERVLECIRQIVNWWRYNLWN
jgi:hypothetical protein